MTADALGGSENAGVGSSILPLATQLVFAVLVVGTACGSSTPQSLPFTPAPIAGSTPESVATATAIPPATATPLSDDFPARPKDFSRARVTRVVDGDTVVLDGITLGKTDPTTGGHHARLIGVDTPEVFGSTECFGREASAFTKFALTNKDVFVTYDVDRVDRYNRALVYVWTIDGILFNARLVAEGYAVQYTVPPNVMYADEFTRLARKARQDDAGLWKGCPA